MRKVTTKPACHGGRTQGDFSSNVTSKEKTPLTPSKQTQGLNVTKTPTGKGLGKAGARRLGRLLKRAIQDQKELTVRGKLALPKTPVRLFKHQIQSEADNVSTTNTAQTKQASHHVSQLILSVVSHCKNRGGISMAELKQTLAAAGYITKNNRQVNVMTKRLVNNETVVQTTRNATIRLNRKKVTDTTHLRMTSVKSPKPHEDLETSKTASKSPKATKTLQKQATKTPKQRGKSHRPTGKMRRQAAVKPSNTQTKQKAHKPKAKTRKPTAKSQKLKNTTLKPAGKSQKLKNTTHKPAGKSQKLKNKTHKAAGKSQKQRLKTAKARRKPTVPGRIKKRSTANKAARVRKTARKAQRTRRCQPAQTRKIYKFYWKRQRRQRPPKTKLQLKTQQRRLTRRRTYYY